jgi:hypothetical protein
MRQLRKRPEPAVHAIEAFDEDRPESPDRVANRLKVVANLGVATVRLKAITTNPGRARGQLFGTIAVRFATCRSIANMSGASK